MQTDKLVKSLLPLCGCLLLGLTGCAGMVPHDLDLENYRQTREDGPGTRALLASSQAEQPRDLPKSRYGNPPVYEVFGKQYRVMDSSKGYREQGVASWYGSKFHGRRTSSGEIYNMYNMTAAHKSLPIPTFVKVTNLENGASIIVKVNDRGPFHAGRIIDLSYAAADRLGVLEHGTAPVEVTAISSHVPEQQPTQAQVQVQTQAQVQVQTQTEAQTAAEHEQPLAGSSADNSSAHIIQVGAFSDAANAESMRRRVDQAMQVPTAYIVSEQDNSLHRVRFGVAAQLELDEVFAQLEYFGIENYSIITP